MPEFKLSTEIECSIEKAFEFHCDTNNLKKITPPGISVEIRDIELPLRLNSKIVLKVTQFGVFSNLWTIRITEFERPHIIEDTQLKGPFRKWVHRHIFEHSDGKTIMTDSIEYELPFGMIGRLADVLVRKLIATQFRYRHKATRELLGEREA